MVNSISGALCSIRDVTTAEYVIRLLQAHISSLLKTESGIMSFRGFPLSSSGITARPDPFFDVAFFRLGFDSFGCGACSLSGSPFLSSLGWLIAAVNASW